MLETKDLILKKAVFDDWQAIYHNLWKHAESARYMMWRPTLNEEDAKERMKRTLLYQAHHKDCYFVYLKETMEAIGFAGIEKINEDTVQECGIALGPEYINQGYGKQILSLFLSYAKHEYKAKYFLYHFQSENLSSRKLQESFHFSYLYTTEKMHPTTHQVYQLCTYRLDLQTIK